MKNKLLFSLIIFICVLFCASLGLNKALAATYYLDPTNGNDSANGSQATPWKTISKVNNSTLQPGDIIDGQNNIFYDRLVIPSSGNSSSYITFRNFTLDGTVSFDSSWTFLSGPLYTESQPWTQFSGDIYKKITYRVPYMLFEDGVQLTPILITDSQGALVLGKGQFTFNNNTLYYRSSDGQPPSSHKIRVARSDFEGLTGSIYANGKNYLRLENIVVKNFDANTSGEVTFTSCDHITLDKVIITNNSQGLGIHGCTNFTITPGSSISGNIYSGIGIDGNSSNLDISGMYDNNGRHLIYNGTYLGYTGDGDNIGIGGAGGTMSNISIHDATISNSGSDNNSGIEGGAGIYLGTSYDMTVSNINILRNKFFGNHSSALYLGPQFTGGSVENNIFYNNNFTKTQNTVQIDPSNPSFTSVVFANNVLYKNTGYSGLIVYIHETLGGSVALKNNIFFNNGRSSDYVADLWLAASPADLGHITESNNLFYRNGTDWDNGNVIEIYNGDFDINHIIGSASGYYQQDSGKGQNDKVVDPKFINPAVYDFHLQSGSPAIDAGINVGITQDIAGNPVPKGSAPDIGAYEYQTSVLKPEDVNSDGQVNTQDLQACANQILGTQSWPRADVNNDGKFDVKDLQRIANVILGV